MVSSSRKHLIIKQTKTFRFHRDVISISACFVWPIVVGWECDTQNLHVLRVEQSYSASAASKVVELFFLSLSALFPFYTTYTCDMMCVIVRANAHYQEWYEIQHNCAKSTYYTHYVPTSHRHISWYRAIRCCFLCFSGSNFARVCLFEANAYVCSIVDFIMRLLWKRSLAVAAYVFGFAMFWRNFARTTN